MRLKDKVILVTGSTTGIGEGMARLFIREGARVVIHGTRKEAAQKLASELGKNTAYVLGGLDDPKVPERLIAETVAHFGCIDGLVNNAAAVVRSNLQTTDVALFDRVIAINLRAPLLLIQAALPHFRKQGGGRVVNIGSINAYCGEKNQLPYSVSKGGLMTLTRNLADAYGPEGLRVNQFNVGWTLTPNEYELKMKEGLSADWPSKVPKAFAPSGRLLSPDDIAWAAVYFLSDEAALINGQVIELEQYPMIGRNPVKET
ncbi:MAG TPA: SDR family oxidoreductase [Candidatus Methylacidiphilales bacterium]|jgi:NAD(P)-dependent dehydrogenase (short-subunit alcohol dehydrogenase family)|nr:SDR family oxidoreductase [Candidatus Methylacidiphilales bacterium]